MTDFSDPALVSLGTFLRQRRLQLGLTQTQLAERLGWVQERISLLENGKYGMPSLPQLARLAASIDSSLAETLQAAGYADVAVAPVQQAEADQQSAGARLSLLDQLLKIDAIDLMAALNETSDLVAQTMSVEKVDVFLYEPASESLVAMGTSHTPMGVKQRQIGLDRMPLANGGRAAMVYQSGETFCGGNAHQDPEELPGITQALGVRSSLLVALDVAGERRGVLSAVSTEPDKFAPEDVTFFQSVSRWVALLAHRAELVRRLTDEAIEETRRTTAEELITVVAHDLANHLTPLKGRIDVIHRRALREERERDVRDAHESALSLARIQRLISDLLDARRLEEGIFALELQPLDLCSLVEETAGQLRSAARRIDVHTPSELMIEGDPNRLAQAVENLLVNALKHSPVDAPITVQVGVDPELPSIVTVTIHDGGPGIPSELLPSLFEPFYRSPASSGLGLGLYIARGITQAHGGTLTVESGGGPGVTFVLSLPCVACPV